MSTLKDSTSNPYSNLSGPAVDLELVVDGAGWAANAGVIARGFYILTATGTVVITTPAGHTVTIPSGLAVGAMHPIACTAIGSTSTATGIVVCS